jgi:2'-5' RNA ligase
LAGFVERAVSRGFGQWTCREVELIQSELSSAGSRYTTLDAFEL